MSLEDKMDACTAAIKALTAILEKGGAVGGSTSGGTAAKSGGTTPKKDEAPKATAEQMKALLLKVKDEVGEDTAKAIIDKAVGKKGSKMAQLANLPAKFDSVVAACEAALEDNGGAAGDPEDEDDGL